MLVGKEGGVCCCRIHFGLRGSDVHAQTVLRLSVFTILEQQMVSIHWKSALIVGERGRAWVLKEGLRLV